MSNSPFSFFNMAKEEDLDDIIKDSSIVYAIDLNQSFLLEQGHILSDGEKEKSRRFATPLLSMRFTAAHVALRLLLGKWLGHAPESVFMKRNAYGKPYVPSGPQFNLSHSGDCAAVILSPAHSVGIDIEQIHNLPKLNEIMEHFFPEEERLEILESHSPLRQFYRHWVLREAFVKSLGTGLSFPIDQIRITFQGSGTPEIQFLSEAFQHITATLREWQPSEGYAGAVAEIQYPPSLQHAPGSTVTRR